MHIVVERDFLRRVDCARAAPAHFTVPLRLQSAVHIWHSGPPWFIILSRSEFTTIIKTFSVEDGIRGTEER